MMKKITFFALAVLFALGQTLAQVNVYQVNKSTAKPVRNGLFYVLPRTVLKIDVLLKTEENLKGPFSEYAAELLGLENVVKFDFTGYSIENIDISPLAEPDPDQVYYIETGERSSKDFRSLMVALNEAGFLVSVSNTDNQEALMGQEKDEILLFNEPNFKQVNKSGFYALRNFKSQTDTIVRKIAVDTASVEKFVYRTKLVEKNPKEQALEIVNLLEETRESRLKLLTGFQETAYDAGTMAYMDKQLQKLENNYLDLFRGKTLRTYKTHTFYYTPSSTSEKDEPVLFRFSKGTGITSSKSGTGDEITLDFILNESALLAGEFPTPQKDESNLSGIAYRIPGSARCLVKNNSEILFDSIITISQLGGVKRLPAQKFKADFDPSTGGITTVRFD